MTEVFSDTMNRDNVHVAMTRAPCANHAQRSHLIDKNSLCLLHAEIDRPLFSLSLESFGNRVPKLGTFGNRVPELGTRFLSWEPGS